MHPRQQCRRRPAEVGGAQLDGPGPVETELLAGVAQLEGRVIVAAVLVVDDPQPLAVVEVVLGQEIVVAGHGRERPDGQGGLDARQERDPVAVARRDGHRVLVHDAQVELRQAEHVEVVPEAWAGVQAPKRRGDAGGHAGLGEGGIRHRPAG